ncbi:MULTISPECIES: MmcQ/YjbR family DNA-binding protein [unclassified Streptomyces]|uniref:MmcQ/YjbR family DNA-binding protein n=1 Tax=unclassified Streptomyces TaxID=2593676 RepID=UPI0033A69FF8
MPISGEKLQDRARDAALALPGASPGRLFTDQLDVCKVAGKVFLIVTDDPDERIVTLKAEPEYGRLPSTNTRRSPRPCQPSFRYPALGGVVTPGWSALVAALPDRPITLAIDGPAAWTGLRPPSC